MKNLVGKKVRVYWNSHKKLFSIRDDSKGIKRVVAYSNSLRLKDVKFIVNQSGWRRVQDTGRKAPHAFCEGIIVSENCEQFKIDHEPISYQPKKQYQIGAFRNSLDAAVNNAKFVLLERGKIFI